MTVVVRTPDNKILVLCKGADSIIEQRLKKDQHHLSKTKDYLNSYADQGLRTLLIARKEIDEVFYD